MTTTVKRQTFLGLLRAIIRQRCPACREGRVFRGLVRMNELCPQCGHRFQEDEGFFLGAMYISYPLATLVLAALYFGLAAVCPGLPEWQLFLLCLPPFLLFVPMIFRYSRVIWMHFISSTRA